MHFQSCLYMYIGGAEVRKTDRIIHQDRLALAKIF
jgi:hypothetical protein